MKIKLEQLARYFDHLPSKSFTIQKFIKIYEEEWRFWGLDKTTTVEQLLEYLLKQRLFAYHHLKDRHGEIKTLLSYRTQDELTIISGLKTDSYFCYQTAMKIHGWITGSSKMIYLNVEHTKDRGLLLKDNELSQEMIDYAFGQPQRQNQNLYSYNGKTIMLTNSKKTNRLGVIETAEQHYYAYTDKERTLIDIVVRPAYAGGVKSVLKAFKKAKGSINIETLKTYLEQLNYIYPYHQAIGFYLEKAGYPQRDYCQFIRPREFDFYLAHDIPEPLYNNKWHVYHPE